MSSTRKLLLWLCCALVLCTGLPLRASAAGGGASREPAPSCCGSQCRCAERADSCGCGTERRRQPAPPAPTAPRPALAAPELQPRLPDAPAAMPAKVEHGDALVQRPSCVLPARTRQEALSVWRC